MAKEEKREVTPEENAVSLKNEPKNEPTIPANYERLAAEAREKRRVECGQKLDELLKQYRCHIESEQVVRNGMFGPVILRIIPEA